MLLPYLEVHRKQAGGNVRNFAVDDHHRLADLFTDFVAACPRDENSDIPARLAQEHRLTNFAALDFATTNHARTSKNLGG
jgi:hypothetical protein